MVFEAAEKQSFVAVEFEYGNPADPDFARFTNWAQDLDLGVPPRKYSSAPELEIEFGLESGSLTDEKTTISMAMNPFTMLLVSGEPSTPVIVRVFEYAKAGPEVDEELIYQGFVSIANANPRGRAGLVELECMTVKQRMVAKLGRVVGHLCPHRFGKKGCAFDVAGETESGMLAAADGATATITGITDDEERRWFRGYVRRGGIHIMVFEYTTGDAFQLVRNPPASWVGQEVDVVIGCDRSIERCRELGNEERFGAIGYGIPAYNPVIENPE